MARYTRFRNVNSDGSGRPQSKEQPPARPTRSQSLLEYALFIIFGALIILGGFAIYSAYSPSHGRVPNHIAEGLKDDRINILIIGVGGDSHPGGGKDLADSILLMSLKPSTKQAAVISIPRDLWVPIGKHGTHRLNAAHAMGDDGGYPGKGAGLLCDTVSKVFNLPIHGFVRVDFAAFEKVIDTLGGVDVFVERGFYDYLFQDGFPRGWQHLNGRRALAYARYRYILGPEGDNFAREFRQQQVIAALRQRLARRDSSDVVRLAEAAKKLSDYTDTNLTTAQIVTLYRTFHTIDDRSIRHISLKPFCEVFDVTRIAEPGEAVRPRTGDYREIQSVVRGAFNGRGEVASEDQIKF